MKKTAAEFLRRPKTSLHAQENPFSSVNVQTEVGGQKPLWHTECLIKHLPYSCISESLTAHRVQDLAPAAQTCACASAQGSEKTMVEKRRGLLDHMKHVEPG